MLTHAALSRMTHSASPPSVNPSRQSPRASTGSLDPNRSFQRETRARRSGGHGMMPSAVESARKRECHESQPSQHRGLRWMAT